MPHTFTGRTLVEAHRAAEASLGDDFVVLDTRRVKKKGVAGWLGAAQFEVEAGVQVEDARPTRAAARPAGATASAAPTLAAPRAFSPSAYAEGHAAAAEITRLHREVRAMRALLYRMQKQPSRVEGELKQLRRAMGTLHPRGGGKHQVARWLEESGIDGAVADQIADALRGTRGNLDRLREVYRDALSEHIHVGRWPQTRGDRPQLVAVVGPPGVGKTTTLAKLAGRALADGEANIAFITCDTFRVGAIEHLARFAEMMGAPIAVARDIEALHRAAASSDADIVFVDTAGRGPEGDDACEAGLADPQGWGCRERHVLLCLDASTRAADTEALSGRYRPCAPTALAITKLDLTATPGALLHGPASTSLPVSTLADGPRVPEDVAPATAGRVLEHLAPRARAEDDPS
ncbi:MAG: flagellar biosynthesis protein FlhF [Myxococcota bacterium]